MMVCTASKPEVQDQVGRPALNSNSAKTRKTEMKTFDELYQAILAILPDAQFDEDNDGQIIVYTNLRETDEEGNLQEFESE